jgi:hypothetical protein
MIVCQVLGRVPGVAQQNPSATFGNGCSCLLWRTWKSCEVSAITPPDFAFRGFPCSLFTVDCLLHPKGRAVTHQKLFTPALNVLEGHLKLIEPDSGLTALPEMTEQAKLHSILNPHADPK